MESPKGPADDAAVENGWLECPCGKYPVLAGIPVIKKDLPPAVMEAAASGRWGDALVALVLSDLPEPFLLRAGRVMGRTHGLSLMGRCIEKTAIAKRERRLRTLVLSAKERYAIREWIYALTPWPEFATYLYYKFGQPRHLVGLSLSALADRPSGRILDLGCGAGHITRALQTRAEEQAVTGVDQYFGLLLCAQRIAPDGEYVCCSAENPLPFGDDCFEYVFSSDAFHNIRNKKQCVNELERIGGANAVLCLGSVRNALARHDYQDEFITPRLFQKLMGRLPHRIVSDESVLARYLRKQGPALSESSGNAETEQAELMTIVASRRQDVFRDYGSFATWPHAVGNLGINPLYVEDSVDGDRVRLRRVFPSTHYETENAVCKKYTPETVAISGQLYRALKSNGDMSNSQELAELIGQFVVVGMPKNYGT